MTGRGAPRTPAPLPALLLAATCLIAGVAAAAGSWVPQHLARYDPYQADGYIDFSRAGHTGETPWDARVVELAAPPDGDAAPVIQAALDDLGTTGGGTLRLGPGTWRIEGDGLFLRHDNLRLEGSGIGGTTLYFPGTNNRFKTAITGGTSNNNTFVGSQSYPDSWVEQGTADSIQYLGADLARGDDFLAVTTPTLSAGTPVIITGDATEAFIAEHGMTGFWTTRMDYPASLREIVEVTPGGYRVDMPVRYAVKTRDGARVFPPVKLVRNLSLAGFTIQFDRHPATEFDFGTGAFETANHTAIKFVNVWNGLVEDIEGPLLPSRGIEVAYSRFVTVRRVRFLESQNQNAEWNGYQFFVWGCDNLFQDCEAVGARRSFTVLMAMAHGNVFHRCTSRFPRFPTDFHMHLSQENLYDNFVGEGDHLECIHRPFGSPILHGISGTENVFWNTTTDREIAVWSAQHGLGYVIGTQGPGRIELGPGNGFAALPLDIAEGEGMGASMVPQSLYEYQLGARKSDTWMFR